MCTCSVKASDADGEQKGAPLADGVGEAEALLADETAVERDLKLSWTMETH